jgi:putative heme-binding domain-containing protein
MGWHYFMDERYLARNPKLAVPSLRRMLNNEPDKLRIYPVSSGVRRLNWPDAVNTLTSGCNAMPYRDTLFGEEYAHSFFICEPANNLVHREVLEPDGISFRSHRAADEQGIEFLASEDNWSRFTQARTGPDGCLYVVDTYRQVIEHPEWIPKLMLEHMDVRAGEDKGRIYRISPTGSQPALGAPSVAVANSSSSKIATIPKDDVLRKFTRLDVRTDLELVTSLESPNGWVRDTAQRLLMERGATGISESLFNLGIADKSLPLVSRLQAMWTYHALGDASATPGSVHAFAFALKDPDPLMRKLGIFGEEGSVEVALRFLLPLANDPDLRVRVQLALTLGESSDSRVPDVLRALAQRDGDNPDMLIALLTAYPKHEAALAEDAKQWQAKLKELQKNSGGAKAPVQIITNNNPDRDKVVRQYAVVTALKGSAEHGHTLYKTICFSCHKLKNEGNEIGPDLSTIAGKPTDQIVEAVMDPSRAVEARYLSTTVTLKDGRVVIGMVAEETANSLTLKTATGTEVFLRADIKGREASTKSIMPDGLEGVMKPQDVADVIEWIRAK